MPRKATPAAPPATRRKFTEEFRRQAIQMILDGHTATSVAQPTTGSRESLVFANSNSTNSHRLSWRSS